VLHTSNTAAGGYFSSVDEYTVAVRKDSNEKEMFYIDLEGIGGPSQVGSSFYLGVLAHEFQHMIHYHVDRNEDTWANEGLSDLAMFLNGYDIGGADFAFANEPDTQLNFWPEGGGGGVNYGGAFTFWLYFYDKYGEKGITDLVADPRNGLDGVAEALKQVGYNGTLDDFFADWVVAKYLNQPKLDDGRYGFTKSNPPLAATEKTISVYPFQSQDSVHHYAAKYFPFRGNKDITVNFTGSTKAKMIDAAPHSGQYFWWSNRGDSTDLSLTREFDLSSVSSATLKYWTWYSLEKDWDYGYLMVSEDGGKSWKILKTPSGTDTDPNNNNYGWGYTGSSGGSTPQWIQETVDLTPYAGKKIMIGFDVVNDLAVNLPGLAIDDVEIPEINYKEDFEKGDGGWQPAGWVRTNNFVPDTFIVQLISFGQDGNKTVTRLPLNADNTGQWDIPLSTLKQAVIAVSATAPKTSEIANFSWSATEK
jgi:immune inhibitor A